MLMGAKRETTFSDEGGLLLDFFADHTSSGEVFT